MWSGLAQAGTHYDTQPKNRWTQQVRPKMTINRVRRDEHMNRELQQYSVGERNIL